ncbi:hypothetical protein GGX14DRAFT_660290 [Mycena pura]|uniref:Uncharacterized protein n=1 Tax=Mycena pura TaxID=153505 RepID=A0AAD6Y973_9AGAR|nr:hypothetical protein GGX14DRAFT_660290 [Mycena pura]
MNIEDAKLMYEKGGIRKPGFRPALAAHPATSHQPRRVNEWHKLDTEEPGVGRRTSAKSSGIFRLSTILYNFDQFKLRKKSDKSRKKYCKGFQKSGVTCDIRIERNCTVAWYNTGILLVYNVTGIELGVLYLTLVRTKDLTCQGCGGAAKRTVTTAPGVETRVAVVHAGWATKPNPRGTGHDAGRRNPRGWCTAAGCGARRRNPHGVGARWRARGVRGQGAALDVETRAEVVHGGGRCSGGRGERASGAARARRRTSRVETRSGPAGVETPQGEAPGVETRGGVVHSGGQRSRTRARSWERARAVQRRGTGCSGGIETRGRWCTVAGEGAEPALQGGSAGPGASKASPRARAAAQHGALQVSGTGVLLGVTGAGVETALQRGTRGVESEPEPACSGAGRRSAGITRQQVLLGVAGAGVETEPADAGRRCSAVPGASKASPSPRAAARGGVSRRRAAAQGPGCLFMNWEEGCMPVGAHAEKD